MNKHPDLHPDTPAWFASWVERSNDPAFARLQGSIDNLGETLVAKLDKLQGSLDRHTVLMFGTSALSQPTTFKELMDAATSKARCDEGAKGAASSSATLEALKAEAKAERIREEEEQAKRKAQIYKKVDEPKPARTQQETNHAILELAKPMPGYLSSHCGDGKVTITVEGGWLTNARLKMPLDVDGTPIEVIDHTEVPGRIEAFARELPGFQSCVVAADRKVHITVFAGKWNEANRMTPNVMYGYRIYLLGVTRPF